MSDDDQHDDQEEVIVEPAGRARLIVALLLVAVGAAAFAVAFRASLHWAYHSIYRAGDVMSAITSLPPWLRVAAPALGGLVAGLVLMRARTQNVSNVMEAVALGRVHLSMRPTVRRTLASWAAIASGMSIGREGPLIEFGGSLGSAVSRAMGLSRDRLRVLVAAGTAAGFGAAYNTPFAAVLFVLETMVGIAALDVLLPIMVATVVATAVTRAAAGGGPIYGQRGFGLASSSDLVLFVALGLVSALVGWLFKHALETGEHLAQRYPLSMPWRTMLGGAVVGLVAIWVPGVAGNGFEPLNLVLDERVIVPSLAALALAKIVATTSSVASGVPGGMFTPVLLVGGVTGALFGHGLHAVGWAAPQDVGAYALVGMAATSAATTHAPLTAAVMIFELSGDYPIVLPLLLATGVSTAVARWLGSESVYASELRRRGLGWELTIDGRRLVE